MGGPDFNNELWRCNGCEEDFNVEVGSYDLEAGDWPSCPECKSGSTEMV